MRMAVLGRRGVVGALSLALLMVPGAGGGGALSAATPIGYAGVPANGIPAPLPPPAVAAPRIAFTDDSDRVVLDRITGEGTDWDLPPMGRHTGEATGPQEGSGLALVSTRDEPHGEVYLGQQPDLQRVTCNASVETHPVLSPSGRMVAYSSDEGGGAHLWVVWPFGLGQSQELLPCEAMPRVILTQGPGADLWPSWVDDRRLVFSSTRADPLGDIWTIPVDGPGRSEPTLVANQLTDGKRDTIKAAETQPVAVSVFSVGTGTPTGSTSFRGVLLTTTEFGNEGSLGVLELPARGPFDVRAVSRLPFSDPQGQSVQVGQSSEADYWESFGQGLTFTTTNADPAGDVRLARLRPSVTPPGVTAVLDGTPIAATPDRAETHGGHYQSVAGGDLFQLYATHVQQADISDTVAADGSGRRTLAGLNGAGPVDERSPTYSPDGTRIAYARQTEEGGSEIVVANADGSGPAALIPGRPPKETQHEPAWSPDGTRIAFVGQTQPVSSDHYGRRTIRVADLATGSVTDLGQELYDTVYDESPSWSPDSTRLVFARREIDIEQTTRLFVVDARTGSSVPLEGPGQRVCGDCIPPVQGRVPAWSPDGMRIAYEYRGSVRVAYLRDADGNGHPDVPEAVASSDAVTGFFDDASRQATPSRPILSAATDPAWSPDGSELAVAGQPAGVPDQSGIYALRPDGTGLRTVAQDRGPETEPAWQPYGDLAVTVTSTAAQLETGESATLTATVTNTGPNPAADVVLSLQVDALTPGTTPAGCTAAGSVLTCPLGTLKPGQSVPKAVPVTGAAPKANVIVATVQSPTPDLRPENNIAQVGLPVGDQLADLSVTMSFGGPGFVAGSGYVDGAGQATVTVTNAGPVAATGVSVTSSLPAGLLKDPSGPACLLQSVACPLPDLAPGATEALVASFRFASAGSAPGTATVTGSTIDPVPGNNSASTVLTVKQPALVLSPEVLAPGGVTIVQGVDFPPGVDVNLLWDRGITEPLPTLGAGPDGAIAPVQVLVFRRDEIGTRNLTAKAVLPDVMNAVTKELLVAPQRLAPPDFLVRS